MRVGFVAIAATVYPNLPAEGDVSWRLVTWEEADPAGSFCPYAAHREATSRGSCSVLHTDTRTEALTLCVSPLRENDDPTAHGPTMGILDLHGLDIPYDADQATGPRAPRGKLTLVAERMLWGSVMCLMLIQSYQMITQNKNTSYQMTVTHKILGYRQKYSKKMYPHGLTWLETPEYIDYIKAMIQRILNMMTIPTTILGRQKGPRRLSICKTARRQRESSSFGKLRQKKLPDEHTDGWIK